VSAPESASAAHRMTRTKTTEVVPLGGDRYHFTVRFTDVGSGGDFGGAESVTVHDFVVEGEVEGPLLTLVRLSVEADTHPYAECPLVIPASHDLVGHTLMSGWRRSVLDQLGGTRGCTHVNTLLMGLSEMTTMVFFLRMNAEVPYTSKARVDGRWMAEGLDVAPSLKDACHGLREDGAAVRSVDLLAALPSTAEQHTGDA